MSGEKLVPAVIQDHKTGEILMLAYMNDESLQKTKETGYTWFWSRSRQKLWNKGETSGNLQAVKEIRYDCDEDTYVVLVEQIGSAACHTGNRSCFYRSAWPVPADVSNAPPQFSSAGEDVLDELDKIIKERRAEMPAGSYTSELLRAGSERIITKIKEEANEVVSAARAEGPERLVEEAADLVYHLMILLADQDLDLGRVKDELRRRRK